MPKILRLLLGLNALASTIIAAGSFEQIPGHWLEVIYREGAVLADGLLIVTAGAWLTWIARVVERVRAIDPHFVQTPAYAIAGHIVPLANLVMPYRTIVGLIDGTRPTIVAWWTGWLLSTGLSVCAYASDSRSMDGAALLVLAVDALLAIKVVSIVEQRTNG